MAKWGKGDPRWIVEERADATNVNNWHWTEKNATPWSKDKLTSLLQGLEIKDDSCECKIKELSAVDGEASASNRKAKLIFFYDFKITGEWKGCCKNSDTSYTGKFEIPNLSEENDADEIDVNVTITSTKNEAYHLKDFMRKKGQEEIRQQVAVYIKELKEEFSKGMILPSKNGDTSTSNPKSKPSVNNVARTELSKPVESTLEGFGVRISCRKYTDKQQFKCRLSELYRAFTDKVMVRAYAGEDAQLEVEKGGRFSLFRGNVLGEFKELDPYKKLVMQWRSKSWPDEHYSTVTLNFEEKEDMTELVLVQTSIPESDYDRTKEGWDRYYWHGIRQRLGFGASLF